jgi:cobalt-zinc-cadmium efflux system outer membrane protein
VRKLQLARKKLSALWGGTGTEFDRAEGDLDDLLPAPDLEELIPLLEKNPGVAAAGIEHERREALLRLEKALGLPDITLSGGMKRFHGTGTDLWLVGVSIPVPLFDRNQGAVLAAENEVERAAEELEAARNRLRLELEQAWNALVSAYEEAEELRNSVLPGAEKVYAASRKSYRRGKTDYLDVLYSQRTMFEARKRYIDLVTEYHRARAELERITGRTLETDS